MEAQRKKVKFNRYEILWLAYYGRTDGGWRRHGGGSGFRSERIAPPRVLGPLSGLSLRRGILREPIRCSSNVRPSVLRRATPKGLLHDCLIGIFWISCNCLGLIKKRNCMEKLFNVNSHVAQYRTTRNNGNDWLTRSSEYFPCAPDFN